MTSISIQQIAALRWLIDENAENTALLKLIASGRLAFDVYDRLSHSSQIDALKVLQVIID
jgi:pantothenate kinase